MTVDDKEGMDDTGDPQKQCQDEIQYGLKRFAAHENRNRRQDDG